MSFIRGSWRSVCTKHARALKETQTLINRHFQSLAQGSSTLRLPLFRCRPVRGGSAVSALLFRLLLVSLPALPAAASPVAEQLERAVERHLDQQLQFQTRQLGWQGLRIEHQHQWLGGLPSQACAGELRISGGDTDPLARQRLELECPANAWRRSLISQPRLFVQAVYATGNIERGATLHGGVLERRELELGKGVRSFYSDLQQLQGLEARRRIRANQLLGASLVKNARLILRGEQLKIIASQHGIAASTVGEALQDGAQGELIRVRNLGSEKVIDAMVMEAGVVSSTY
jgi:flagella basal body P-ring formation protein FlgA